MFNNHLYSDVSHPLPVDLVAARVARQRLHIACGLLETPQVLRAVVEEDVLVPNVVARQEQSHGRGETQPAVASIC